jgi:hypothetical protein
VNQQQLDNTTQFNSLIKRYILSDQSGNTEVIFLPQAPTSKVGEPQLNYRGPEGQFTFTGNEIHQQRTALGLLLTVVLQPDLDAGQLNLTLALPPINLAGNKAQEFETLAIKTRSQGHVIDPGGATLTYRALMLAGVAQAVIDPFVTPLSESTRSDQTESLTHNGDIQAVQPPQPVQKILEITELNVRVLESFPPQLQVSVFGTVPSAGWTNPQLVPYTYVQAPPDGIYDFDFMASPPKEMSAQVVSPIRVKTTLSGQDIKGIRVYASLNAKEFLLNPEEAPCMETQAV